MSESPDAIVFAMDLCGADLILNLGGVQGIMAMAKGFFGGKPADILVAPGNSYVAEAKRMLFGEVGIDMFAGPTDSLIIADHTASAEIVAWDLVSQAEHGIDSPVWLVSTDRALAEGVLNRVSALIDSLPDSNAAAARIAWTSVPKWSSVTAGKRLPRSRTVTPPNICRCRPLT